MEKYVSIILPNYNHSAFLQKRLDSILNQTHQDFELIILDDASTDTSFTILENYKNHPKVSHFIVNQQNSGSPFKQWKKGLELAKGNIIWIAESDDYCDLNFLETQLRYLESNEVSVAKTIIYNKEKFGKELKHPAFKNKTKTILENEQILYCPILNVSAAVFKMIDKEKLAKAKFSEYSIIGDRVFYHEFFNGQSIVFNDNTHNYFRQEEENLSNLNTKSLAYLCNYFREHTRFINTASKNNSGVTIYRKKYINRFFNRVKNRISKREKISITYLNLYLYKEFQLLKRY